LKKIFTYINTEGKELLWWHKFLIEVLSIIASVKSQITRKMTYGLKSRNFTPQVKQANHESTHSRTNVWSCITGQHSICVELPCFYNSPVRVEIFCLLWGLKYCHRQHLFASNSKNVRTSRRDNFKLHDLKLAFCNLQSSRIIACHLHLNCRGTSDELTYFFL